MRLKHQIGCKCCATPTEVFMHTNSSFSAFTGWSTGWLPGYSPVHGGMEWSPLITEIIEWPQWACTHPYGGDGLINPRFYATPYVWGAPQNTNPALPPLPTFAPRPITIVDKVSKLSLDCSSYVYDREYEYVLEFYCDPSLYMQDRYSPTVIDYLGSLGPGAVFHKEARFSGWRETPWLATVEGGYPPGSYDSLDQVYIGNFLTMFMSWSFVVEFQNYAVDSPLRWDCVTVTLQGSCHPAFCGYIRGCYLDMIH